MYSSIHTSHHLPPFVQHRPCKVVDVLILGGRYAILKPVTEIKQLFHMLALSNETKSNDKNITTALSEKICSQPLELAAEITCGIHIDLTKHFKLNMVRTLHSPNSHKVLSVQADTTDSNLPIVGREKPLADGNYFYHNDTF